jgi:hypothetical protein
VKEEFTVKTFLKCQVAVIVVVIAIFIIVYFLSFLKPSPPTEADQPNQPTAAKPSPSVAEAQVPVLNEQGVELVTNLLLQDMQTSVRGGDALMKPEEMLRLTGIDLEATAEQYDADYAANEIAADQKYKGRKILLTGVIGSINKDFKGDAYIVLKANNPFMGVHAELNERGTTGASTLAKDTVVYLVCDSGTRIIGSAVARNCQQFSQYLDQIRPSLKSAFGNSLREQSSTPTKLAQSSRFMYVIGTQLPPDSPCFTGTDDACKASLAAIMKDNSKMRAFAEQFKRTFPADSPPSNPLPDEHSCRAPMRCTASDEIISAGAEGSTR